MLNATTLENKDALIARLLDSPLAQEIERNFRNGAVAVRQRAVQELEQRLPQKLARRSKLDELARVAADDLAKAKLEFERAALAASKAGDGAMAHREAVSQWRAELESVTTAGEQRLREMGLSTVADFEAKFARR